MLEEYNAIGVTAVLTGKKIKCAQPKMAISIRIIEIITQNLPFVFNCLKY